MKRRLGAKGRKILLLAVFPPALTLAGAGEAVAQQRLYGIDVSDWQQEGPAPAYEQFAPIDWTLVHAPVNQGGGGKDFAFIRSTRGGTTGTYDKHAGTGTLSQRYDDYRFVENITNATAAGVYCGPYHFTKADIATNTGTDEADHMLEV